VRAFDGTYSHQPGRHAQLAYSSALADPSDLAGTAGPVGTQISWSAPDPDSARPTAPELHLLPPWRPGRDVPRATTPAFPGGQGPRNWLAERRARSIPLRALRQSARLNQESGFPARRRQAWWAPGTSTGAAHALEGSPLPWPAPLQARPLAGRADEYRNSATASRCASEARERGSQQLAVLRSTPSRARPRPSVAPSAGPAAPEGPDGERLARHPVVHAPYPL
jgi:hypothetical protein